MGKSRSKMQETPSNKNIDAVTEKLQGTLRIPTGQNVAKIVWTFQCMNNQ